MMLLFNKNTENMLRKLSQWMRFRRSDSKCSRLLMCVIVFFALITSSACLHAQQDSIWVEGKVMSGYGDGPVVGAVVAVDALGLSVQTDVAGRYKIKLPEDAVELTVWMPGFYTVRIPLLNRSEIDMTLIPDSRYRYYADEEVASPAFVETPALYQRDYRRGASTLEQVMQGQFAGLNVVNKGGMPGEGAALNFRGIRSFEGSNAPLLVVNGVPYLPDMETSPVIGGYSGSVFNPFNIRDIQSVRLLKGAEAALYGSMGSNGVLLLETAKPNDMETVIEFSGNYGVANNKRVLPVLGTRDFKSYIGDVGLTQFDDMGEMLAHFPFLRDDPEYYYNFLYNSKTDWQSLVYQPAFVTDNHIRVKGGDAVAKYNLALGVTNQGGALDNSAMTRYSTRMNASVALGRKFDLLGTVALSYVTSNLHEQGMLKATSPILTALNQAPILSPYTKDEYNNELPRYDIVRQFNISNPMAVLNTMSVRADVYDVFVNAGVNYRPNIDWTIGTTIGIYTNYNRQSTFVPGLSSRSIVALEDGVALNSARAGSGQVSNLFYQLNADYKKSFGAHRFEGGLGYDLTVTRQEFDAGKGRNTSSDFYRTLQYVTHQSGGRTFFGYNELWNRMALYGYGRLHLNNQFTFSGFLSADGASSTGTATNRFGLFPGAELKWRAVNSEWLSDQQLLNQLDLRIGYSLTGNSRFSSNLGKSAYRSQIYRQLSGIVVGGIPNDKLRWEENYNLDAGIDVGLFNSRLQLGLTYYNTQTKQVIQAQTAPSVAALSHLYINGGTISNQGIELDLSAAIIERRDFSLSLGASVSTNKSRLASMQGEQERIIELGDGTAIISRVGETPYAFYGYRSKGVIASDQEASSLGLIDYKGLPFEAGDIRFEDFNNDNVIDRKDRVIIGNPNPDWIGGAYVDVRYKRVSLTGYFNFSYGNELYNGVRRHMESMSDYGNQSTAVLRRWKADGQVTDVPRATYGDPMENSRFSSRWIEDGSFLRLSNLALRYKMQSKRFRFLEGAEVYVAGENLFTWTNYLGLDPELSFSYDPMLMGIDYGNLAQPRTFRAGINVLF